MFFRTIKIHHHELQRENQQLKKATKELQKEIQTLSQSKTTLKEAVSEDDKALLQNDAVGVVFWFVLGARGVSGTLLV